jgi:hypothetical protein
MQCRNALLIGALTCASLCADNIAALQKPRTQPAGSPASDSAQAPSEEFARQLLAAAQANAKSASPVVRTKVWLELAKQCAADGDRSKERVLLGNAFAASLEIPPVQNNYHWVLQAETLRILINDFGPEPVEELLPQMDENIHGMAFDMLVARYVDDGNWDKAIDAVRRAPTTGWFPFVQTERLMAKLPPQRVADRALIFGMAYRICDGKHIAVSSLTTMIEKFWRDLSENQVVDTIPRIFKEALRAQAFPVLRKVNAYDDLKPKLLSILKALDPAKAEQWEGGEDTARAEARKACPMYTFQAQKIRNLQRPRLQHRRPKGM